MESAQHPPTLRSFGDYYVGTIFRPRPTFDALISDGRRVKFGAIALATNALLYTLVYVFLTAGGGAPSSIKPWLAIPAEVYYSYDRVILAPSMFGCWILAAGVAQLLSKSFSGRGTFEDQLSVFGFGTTIACLASLLHDLPDSFLGAIGLLDLRAYEVVLNSPTVWRVILLTLYGLSAVWYVVLYSKGTGAAQRIKPGPAILVGTVAYVVYQGVFLIFNR